MNYMLQKENLPPLVIEKEFSSEYIKLLAHQDIKGLIVFCSSFQEKENARLQQFKNMELTKIKHE